MEISFELDTSTHNNSTGELEYITSTLFFEIKNFGNSPAYYLSHTISMIYTNVAKDGSHITFTQRQSDRLFPNKKDGLSESTLHAGSIRNISTNFGFNLNKMEIKALRSTINEEKLICGIVVSLGYTDVFRTRIVEDYGFTVRASPSGRIQCHAAPAWIYETQEEIRRRHEDGKMQ